MFFVFINKEPAKFKFDNHGVILYRFRKEANARFQFLGVTKGLFLALARGCVLLIAASDGVPSRFV